jgi:type III secretory pathway component EscV
MLDRLEKIQPALVREVVPRLVPTILLAEILARLVEEQVPVRNLRGILATLAEWARTEADPAALAERVRESLAAVISRQVAPEGKLEALLLDPAVEQILDAAVTRTPNGTTLGLNPEDGQAILNGYEQAAGTRGSNPVILTRPELRRPFWKLMSTTHPAVRVVSFLELDPNTSIHPAGKIELAA